MVRSKFAPKSTPSRGPIAKPQYLPYPWTRPTYGAERLPAAICRFSTMHWTDRPTDRPTDRHTDRPTDRTRESLMTIGRCAPRATRPNNTNICHKGIQCQQFQQSQGRCQSLGGQRWKGVGGLSKIEFSHDAAYTAAESESGSETESGQSNTSLVSVSVLLLSLGVTMAVVVMFFCCCCYWQRRRQSMCCGVMVRHDVSSSRGTGRDLLHSLVSPPLHKRILFMRNNILYASGSVPTGKVCAAVHK